MTGLDVGAAFDEADEGDRSRSAEWACAGCGELPEEGVEPSCAATAKWPHLVI